MNRGGGDDDRPRQIVVSSRSQSRLDELARIHSAALTGCTVEYVVAGSADANDNVLRGLSPGSLVINATGLGKDAAGSPLAGAVPFPEGAIIWELNYRGELVFLEQARAQAASRNLTLVDGWTYFLHGWMQVIAEVFDISIPASGVGFERLSRLALSAAKG